VCEWRAVAHEHARQRTRHAHVRAACPQAELLAAWYSGPQVAQLLTISKLWLYNNALGDEAAPALAAVVAAR
jgi:hypothetical protein